MSTDHTPPTDAELAEWERLANEASPEPWEIDSCDAIKYYAEKGWEELEACGVGPFAAGSDNSGDCTHLSSMPDASFVSAARTALPRLIAEVRRLRAALATTREHPGACPRTNLPHGPGDPALNCADLRRFDMQSPTGYSCAGCGRSLPE